MICKECGKEIATNKGLSIHLRQSHNMTTKLYYDKHLLKENDDKCPECGKQCNFIDITKGYHTYCSVSCQSKASNRNRECFLATEVGKQKIRETLLKRYDVDHSSKIPGINDKRNKTHLEKTGYDLYHDPNIIQKRKENTNNRWINYELKTGYKHPNYNPEVLSKMNRKYRYNNVYFDSSWEIAYYIYLIDHNIDFQFHVNSFEYEFENKTYKYYPDFLINEQFIEIKGKHLLNWMKQNNTKDNAKYNCMLEHNVKIISDEEIKPILDYINEKYGKDYLKQFKYEK